MSVKDQFQNLMRLTQQKTFVERQQAQQAQDEREKNMSFSHMNDDSKHYGKLSLKQRVKPVLFATGLSLLTGVVLYSGMAFYNQINSSEAKAKANESTPIAARPNLASIAGNAPTVEEKSVAMEDKMIQQPIGSVEAKINQQPISTATSATTTAGLSLSSTNNIQFIEKVVLARGVKADNIKSIGSGLYEIRMGKQLAYMTEDGRMLIEGNVSDLKQGKNLTFESMADLLHINPEALKKENAITIRSGSGAIKLSVFIDPSHSKSKKVFRELMQGNYTANIYLVALPGFAQSERLIRHAWCGELGDPSSTLSKIMLDKKYQADLSNARPPSCKTPIIENMSVMQQFDVPGVPAIYDMQGKFVTELSMLR
jgi:thiol:disulfide interchange protein DsbC